MASLRIRNVCKHYGRVPVLNGIDIDVADGEFLILVGPSGCGKSTLLNMIAGLESTVEGQIIIGDRVVNGVSPKDRDIAMVFQSYALYPSMTVRENIEFAMEMRKVPRAERACVVARVAKVLQIEALLERRPAQLSGGQRQRVAMGRALARNPRVFLFDEPLSNLDAKLRVEMRAEIKSLHQRLRATIVYVTHDQVEAMTLGDRIAVMRDGQVQQLGTPEEIYERPANLYVAGFIGAPTMNLLPATLDTADGRWEVSLQTAAGSVRLTLGPATQAEWHGRPAILGLRPEHFTEVDAGTPGALPVRLNLLEPTGADTFAFAEINGLRAGLRLAPRHGRRVGDTVWLRPDGASACLFDPASERRITP
ncbi:ABC transporter ATP-binding protein [Verminephrobacter aporrectodeae]|uniref:Sn-glycerol-3-phosphate ABC transporter ATP-binding protein UgpC n=1 Tax=Verminephrobacter aporrectodeae subsp. tuberculatae TaxID=1110392 RepID=A0ABT3KSH7_9BURK|nr:sn-glycerol-3-phosphate ABC transporter ATP-binding protein UgpC [Verminephrobacter aporrectodeae]MCW5257570.1 sn-glycerol-3-phosphate ABC transporter ATP-binding protein UgpC [Verminephrobacter aporrectodeae subsp. tuberculatae]MCW5321268.1 sn-glycerol-3-phosphate ABC transporter ATP-binding protein UgpC [Verminephrobacter aporrectodeae subsp. tuberculatae]MCW8164918.1 sn-glycerol-3-phosphate ABC transporter ATP-binding protein UgpC [Verminephrobacter aporrectodeae subsp. tuberculatae]MCW81